MDIKLPALISVIHSYFDKKGALKNRVEPYTVHGCDLVQTITEESPYAYSAQATAELYALEATGDKADIFDVIDYVVRAEEFHFGKRMTDLKYPESIVRAFIEYSLEELFDHSPTLKAKWDEKLSAKDLNNIGKEVLEYVQSDEGRGWWYRSTLNNAY